MDNFWNFIKIKITIVSSPLIWGNVDRIGDKQRRIRYSNWASKMNKIDKMIELVQSMFDSNFELSNLAYWIQSRASCSKVEENTIWVKDGYFYFELFLNIYLFIWMVLCWILIFYTFNLFKINWFVIHF